MRLDIKRELCARSDRVKSVDLHPTEPWVLTSLYSGTIVIWNISTGSQVFSLEVSDLPTRCARFVPRKQWVVCGSDDLCVRVINYNTRDKVKTFEAHGDYIRCVAPHESEPLLLTSADDLQIRLWDWERNWQNLRVFEGHAHYVMHVAWSPKDPSLFASASLDRTVKVWDTHSPDPRYTLEGHTKGVNSVDFFRGGDRPFLITGSDDRTCRVWDYQTKSCVHTLEGHTHNVASAQFHPTLPVILSVSEDATVRVWHANTYRLENTLNYGLERGWCVASSGSSKVVALGFDQGCVAVRLGSDEPAVSMDASGKIIWARHQEIQTSNVKAAREEDLAPLQDGERVPLPVKDLGSCEMFPQALRHNRNGRFVAVCGDGEYVIYTALAWRNKSFGTATEFCWAADAGEYATREGSTTVRTFRNFKERTSFRPPAPADGIFGGALLAVRSADAVTFYDWETCVPVRRIDECPRQVYWSDAGDIVAVCCEGQFYLLRYDRDAVADAVAEAAAARAAGGGAAAADADDDGFEDAFEFLGEVPDTVVGGHWVGDCFIYTSAARRLNYCVGGEVVTVAHLDRPMTLLGYLANHNRVFLFDKAGSVVSYTLVVSVLEYQTAVVRGEWDRARELLATSVPADQRAKIARFLEQQGHDEEALEVSTDDEHRFELAVRLGRLAAARAIAEGAEERDPSCADTPSQRLKWRQIADLALAGGDLDLAERCMDAGGDLPGLLLLHTSAPRADRAEARERLLSVAARARAEGRLNVAFAAHLVLRDTDACVADLLAAKRLPEAAFFARTYRPSMVPGLLERWRADLAQVSARAAEALADPGKYANLFPGYPEAVEAEEAGAKRGIIPGAERRSAKDYAAVADEQISRDVVAEAGAGADAGAAEAEAEAQARAAAQAEAEAAAAKAAAEAEAEAEAEVEARAKAEAEAQAAAAAAAEAEAQAAAEAAAKAAAEAEAKAAAEAEAKAAAEAEAKAAAEAEAKAAAEAEAKAAAEAEAKAAAEAEAKAAAEAEAKAKAEAEAQAAAEAEAKAKAEAEAQAAAEAEAKAKAEAEAQAAAEAEETAARAKADSASDEFVDAPEAEEDPFADDDDDAWPDIGSD